MGSSRLVISLVGSGAIVLALLGCSNNVGSVSLVLGIY